MGAETARLAYLHALPSGLAVGLPDGRHLLITAAGVQERTGEAAGTVAHPWGEVTDLAVEARARRVPGVGPALLALSVAAEAIGLGGWVPDAVPVVASVGTPDGPRVVDCDGPAVHGYPPARLAAAEAALHLLTWHPDARRHLDDPARALADARRAPSRRRLAETWGQACTC